MITKINITPEKEIADVISSMNQEELKDYIKVCGEIDKFSREMKIRFAQKIQQGRIGWDSANFYNVTNEINARLERFNNGDNKALVGIANFAFIEWYNNLEL